jgi:tryptophanase
MLAELFHYLLKNGIPENKWSFSVVDDIEKNGVKKKDKAEFQKEYEGNFDMNKLNTMIKNAKIKAQEEIMKEVTTIDNISFVDYETELSNIREDKFFNSLSEEEFYQQAKIICESTDANNKI